jgi:hypothetical protein
MTLKFVLLNVVIIINDYMVPNNPYFCSELWASLFHHGVVSTNFHVVLLTGKSKNLYVFDVKYCNQTTFLHFLYNFKVIGSVFNSF